MKNTIIKLGTFSIGCACPPLVVAEISANHDGKPDKAHRLIDAVAETGTKAVKFQLYQLDEMVADVERIVTWGPPGRKHQESVGAMFQRLSLSREVFPELLSHAKERGLLAFVTPYSEKGADFLLSLDVPCFKIAASDVTHLPLLRHIARLGRPVILSLGKCTLAEADVAISCLQDNGCCDLALLHCVATYPSPIDEMNLRVIPTLQANYPECVIGFSDHSIGIIAPVAAVALGAAIVEKHVTLNREDPGPDHWFSLDMEDLGRLVMAVHDTYVALGYPRKRILVCESQGREKATRSLIATRDLKAGSVLRLSDIKVVRPGGGFAPALLDEITGMILTVDVKANTVLTWAHFKRSY